MDSLTRSRQEALPREAAVLRLPVPAQEEPQHRQTCNPRKLGKPQILCFGFLLITPFHGVSRAFEGA